MMNIHCSRLPGLLAGRATRQGSTDMQTGRVTRLVCRGLYARVMNTAPDHIRELSNKVITRSHGSARVL